jgi:hypothetical protein
VRRSARHARFTQLPIRRLTPPAARGKARPKVLLRCAAVVPMPEVLPVSLRRFRPFGAPRIFWGSLTSEPSRVCLTRSHPTISRVASLPPSPLERRTTSSSQLECSSGPFATRRGLWLTRTCIPRILQVWPKARRSPRAATRRIPRRLQRSDRAGARHQGCGLRVHRFHGFSLPVIEALLATCE